MGSIQLCLLVSTASNQVVCFPFLSSGRANTPLQDWGLLCFSAHVPPGQSQTPVASCPGMCEGSASLCVLGLFGDGTTNLNEITL